jgi:hypothetical protein
VGRYLTKTNKNLNANLNKVSDGHPIRGQDDCRFEIPQDVNLAGLVQARERQQQVARRSKVQLLAAVKRNLEPLFEMFKKA